MKKLLNICLLLTSLTGYLEWGKDNHAFLFQAERDLFLKNGNDTQAFLHPFILLPLCGQLMILFTLFQKTPNRLLTLTGLTCMSTIMLFLFVIGLIALKINIVLSAIPFIVTGVLVLRHNGKKRTITYR